MEKAVKRRKKESEQTRKGIAEPDHIFKRIYEEVTPTIVNEFVKKIIVYAPDKSSEHRRQKIKIVWNFIRELEQNEDA